MKVVRSRFDPVETAKEYVQSFNWDDTKFPRSRTLMEISQTIQDRVRSIDTDIKQYMDEYAQVAQALNQLLKSKGGSFMTGDLSEVIYKGVDEGTISPELFIDHESKFLKNVLVVVPERKEREFLESYVFEDEKNDISTVPGSARDTGQRDSAKNRLYRVVLFHKFDDFQAPRSIAGFQCKMFDYDKDQFEADKRKIKDLTETKQKQGDTLLRRCKLTFSELYISSIHLKVVRTYIDGVLRFGIPPTFLMTILDPKKNEKRIFQNLIEYMVPDKEEQKMYGDREKLQDSEDFYPFVVVPSTI